MGQLSQVCACLVDGGVVAILKKQTEAVKSENPVIRGFFGVSPTMVAAFAMHMTPEKSTVFSSGD